MTKYALKIICHLQIQNLVQIKFQLFKQRSVIVYMEFHIIYTIDTTDTSL